MTIYYAVSDTVRNPGRSGIQSVVRSLAAAFGAAPDRFPPVCPVVWTNRGQGFRPLPRSLSLGLGAEPLRPAEGSPGSLLWQPECWAAWLAVRTRTSELPLHLHPRYRRDLAGSWLLLPELAYRGRAGEFLDYAHRHGLRVAAVFHDAIPLRHPEFVPGELPADHAAYMRAISRADLILPNSEASARDWEEFVAAEGLPRPAVRVCTLASEIAAAPRVLRAPPEPGDPAAPVRVLVVSTLEPRKNHLTLLEAFSRALSAQGRPRLELDLVGSPYVGAWSIVEQVHRTMRRWPGHVRWHERVEHSFLRTLYQECDFTVYPSVAEGFGLPVIESLWFGRPCVCAHFGVMVENAAGGGCLTVDVRNPDALAAAILTLAESPGLRRKLAVEATTRRLKTWHEYAAEIVAALRETGGVSPAAVPGATAVAVTATAG